MAETAASQLSGCIEKFEPSMAETIRKCRAAMRRRFQTANELVYDNYNFFVIGYCPTERPSGCKVSLATNSKGVNLDLMLGSKLPDPHRILSGTGSLNRFVRLEGAATLATPDVKELLNAAEKLSNPPFPKSGAGKLIIRSISAKQRPRS